MYGCECRIIKIPEHRRTDVIEQWCWRGFLRVPWITRIWNLPVLTEINPVYSLEGLMLKISSNILTTWCEEPTQWKRPWCWERLRAREEGDNRGLDGWMASPTQRTWVWENSWRWWRKGKLGVLQSMSSQRVIRDWTTEETFVIACLSRSKCLLILWLQSSSAVIMEPKKIKSVTVSTFFPSICHEVMGPDAMILVFWMLSLSHLFHSPLLPSSGSSLVLLHFLSLEWYQLHIWGCWYFSWQSWFQLVSHPAQHFA